MSSTHHAGGSSRRPSASELAAEAEAKRRKVQRACDVCRRKKIRCEGPMNSNSAAKCANCQEYGLECTYVEAAKRRGPPKGYIETLEHRCGRLERLLNQLHPGLDVVNTVGPMPDRDEFDADQYREQLRSLNIPPYPALKATPVPTPHPSALGTGPAASPAQEGSAAPSPPTRVLGPAPWQTYERDPNRPPEDDDLREHTRLARAFVRLSVRDAEAFRFHGKASGAHLVRLVNELKSETDSTFLDRLQVARRVEYWLVPEWEKVIANENLKAVDYSVWPDEGLASTLIENYFEHVNSNMPLLNRVIFQRQYASGLWSTNPEFAKMCLMVFANGARYTDDERVYWPTNMATTTEGRDRLMNDLDGTLKYSAGWKYLRVLCTAGRSWLQGPTLLDLQINVLVCVFLNGSAVPHLAWLAAGSGIRMAQEIGVHVRSTLTHTNPIDRALYNRAFWCLYHFDRVSCAAIGRSVAIQDSDFDADYPIAVDDEYWDTGDPERDFKQPPGMAPDPSISAFILLLKLDHVLGAALRTIYAVNRLPEHGPDQRAIVIELDSALNSWADSVPDHLRWDPTRSDANLFARSAILYAFYYYVQILIHRPFIPTRKNPESIGFPSLAICSNAARSICNILDAVLRRGRQSGAMPGRSVSIQFALPASTAAIVLLMNVYAVRQRPSERERCLNDVKRILAALRDMELTYRQAGKMTDLISEVARESTGGFTDLRSAKRSFDDSNDTPPSIGTPGAPDLPPLAAPYTSRPNPADTTATPPSSQGASPRSCVRAGDHRTPPTPPGMIYPWGYAPGSDKFSVSSQPSVNAGSNSGSGGTPTGGLSSNAMFDMGDLQSLNYAVTNFDMMADANGDPQDFWAQLINGPGLVPMGPPVPPVGGQGYTNGLGGMGETSAQMPQTSNPMGPSSFGGFNGLAGNVPTISVPDDPKAMPSWLSPWVGGRQPGSTNQ